MVTPARILRIGDFRVPVAALENPQQTYAPVNQPPIQRKMNGDGYTQQAWGGKVRTEITGEGHAPNGIRSPALAVPRIPVALHCLEPVVIQSSSPNIALPVGQYRTDGNAYYPRGYVLTGDDTGSTRVPTVVTGGVAVLEPAAGGARYEVQYWPVLIMLIESFEENVKLPGDKFGWRLAAQQI